MTAADAIAAAVPFQSCAERFTRWITSSTFSSRLLTDLPGFLDGFIAQYGYWVYGLLFAIIFAETGLVVGALPARRLAAVHCRRQFAARRHRLADLRPAHRGGRPGRCRELLGGQVDRTAGVRELRIRRRARPRRCSSTANRRHLDRAHAFYEKYGGKAVILGRFVPIVPATFVPFVAGAGAMNYSKFVIYNVIGAVLWVGVCVGAGYAFGNIEWVKKNFEAVVVGIIVVSVIPVGVEFLLAQAQVGRDRDRDRGGERQHRRRGYGKAGGRVECSTWSRTTRCAGRGPGNPRSDESWQSNHLKISVHGRAHRGREQDCFGHLPAGGRQGEARARTGRRHRSRPGQQQPR